MLKRLLPLVAVYLLLLAAWPTMLPVEQWQFSIDFEQLAFYAKIVFISILPIFIITAASLYGAMIYRLQLSAIERLNF